MSDSYLLDTSFLINGWTKRYRQTVFPTLWETLDSLFKNGTVMSCHAVYAEIEKGGDDLLAWCKSRKKTFHAPTEKELIEVRKVMKAFPNFAAMGGSKNDADPFVIAHACTRGAVVVTDELRSKIGPTKPPKIPVVCEHLSIKWMDPCQFLEAVGIRY